MTTHGSRRSLPRGNTRAALENPPSMGSPPSIPSARGLAQLLGATRARILVTIAASRSTTTEVARRSGVAPASASEHAAILREAGLITTHRTGSCVLHTITTLGAALVNGTLPANDLHRPASRHAVPYQNRAPAVSQPLWDALSCGVTERCTASCRSTGRKRCPPSGTAGGAAR